MIFVKKRLNFVSNPNKYQHAGFVVCFCVVALYVCVCVGGGGVGGWVLCVCSGNGLFYMVWLPV